MIGLKTYNSIHEIAPQLWDSLLTADDIFHTHSFISIVEDSKVENADFRYLLFYENEDLLATTVLSAFYFSPDLFISDNWLVKKFKNYFLGLFKIKILVCGLPASFGQLNLKVKDEKLAADISMVLAKEMRGVAQKLNIHLLTIKEFNENERKLFGGFEKQGFFCANSIPYMHINLQWRDFDEYLNSLRHHYRRKIMLSLKKTGHTKPIISPFNEYNTNSDAVSWVLAQPGSDFAKEFFRLYLRVMGRTATKLETLNEAFFEKLMTQKEAYQLLHLIVKGKIISSAILAFSADTLTFMLAGRENEKDEYDSYFNLVYGIMVLAFQTGCKKIKLGQTAYWVKQCVGAASEPEYIYFASRRPVIHWVLKSFKKIIFPELKLKRVNVFKEQTILTE